MSGRSYSVWLVWTEHGEYEDWSRDLRGAFPTREIAEAHVAQLQAEDDRYDVCEATEEPILASVPVQVPYIKWSAHILPNGEEDEGLGYDRGVKFQTWDNEITAVRGRLGKWYGNYSDKPDLFIEVIGSDPEAVKLEYERLLADARQQLAAVPR